MCACSCISSKRYAHCKHNIDLPYTVKKEKKIPHISRNSEEIVQSHIHMTNGLLIYD